MFHVWVESLKVASTDDKQAALHYGFQYRDEGRVVVKDGNKIIAVMSASKKLNFNPAPKPLPKKRGKQPASQADLKYMLAVKGLPCAVCDAPAPSDCHHTICGRFGSRKTPARDCIPLCKIHHQWGPDAIHNSKESWVEQFGLDTNYIEQTRMLIEER